MFHKKYLAPHQFQTLKIHHSTFETKREQSLSDVLTNHVRNVSWSKLGFDSFVHLSQYIAI